MSDESLGHAEVVCRTLGLIKPDDNTARKLIKALKQNPDNLHAAYADYAGAARQGNGQEAKGRFCATIEELTGINLNTAETQRSR